VRSTVFNKHWRSATVPNDLEEQLASYFSWVEASTGFPLHRDASAEAAAGRLSIEEAMVLDVPGSGGKRTPSRFRVAAIGLVAAAVVVGVIVMANRPVAEREVPANSVPPTDSALQDEAAKRFEELLEARRAAEEARQAAEEARRAAEAAALNAATAALPAEAAYSTADGPVPVLAGDRIVDMKMTDSTSGWVFTSDVLAHTADGGATWQSQPLPPLSNTTGDGKSFILDDDHAWVVRVANDGSVVVTKSSDGAATATATTIGTGFHGGIPAGIAFADQQNGFVSIVNPATQSVTLTGRATLFHTADGGATFELVDSDSPVPLAFSDSQTGWASGEGLFVTTDGAATWTQVTPPLWDSKGPDPTGPAYQIISTSADLTVVKVTAPTGTQAQVVYVSTNDHGKTWSDVAPPDTGEVNNTGPQSTLTVVSDTNWFGIQPTGQQDAILWTRTTGAASYHSTHLPFPAVNIMMATATVGWSATSTDIRSTVDGGATWAKLADVIAPVTLSAGCTWQPSFGGLDGAGQHDETVIRLTNTGSSECAPPRITSITGDAPDGSAITATQGGYFPVDPAPSRVAVGDSIVVVMTTISAIENCSNAASRPVTSLVLSFESHVASRVTLDHSLETACAFAYDVGAA
jgi:hypothetical protein